MPLKIVASMTSISGAERPTWLPSGRTGPGWDSPAQVHAAECRLSVNECLLEWYQETYKAFDQVDTTKVLNYDRYRCCEYE